MRGMTTTFLATVSKALALALFPASVLADPAQRPSMQLADPSGFQERFSGATPVSGQMLSGLAYESTEGALDLDAVGLGYPYSDGAETICVRMTTDDGRYWAINLYAASQPPSGSPPLLTVPTNYGNQLSQYSNDGLLLLASRSSDCADLVEHPLIPGLIGARAPGGGLLAYVNVSQGRVQAWLEHEGARVSEPASCSSPSDGTKVTYSHVCNLDISGSGTGEHYDLVVSVRSMTGSTLSQRYGVYVE